jgi:WD40 repeat protein
MSFINDPLVRARVQLITMAALIGIAALRQSSIHAQEDTWPTPRLTLEIGKKNYDHSYPQYRFSPAGQFVVSWMQKSMGGGFFGFGGSTTMSDLTLWDVTTGRKQFFAADRFDGYCFSSDENTLVLLHANAASIFGTKTGALLAELDHEGVYKAQFCRNEELLLTISRTPDWKEVRFRDGTMTIESVRSETILKCWNSSTWAEEANVISARGTLHYDPAISGDGKTVAAFVADGSDSTKLRIWDVDSGLEQPAPDINAPIGYLPLMFDPDDQTLAVPTGPSLEAAYWDINASKWKTDRKYIVPSRNLHGWPKHQPAVSVELSAGNIIVRDWATETVRHEFQSPATWQPVGTDLFPFQNGCRLAGNQFLLLYSEAIEQGEINFWDLDTQKLTETIRTSTPVTCMALANDGNRLAVTTSHRSEDSMLLGSRVAIWDVPEKRELFVFHHEQFMAPVAFSPDGKLLATGSGHTVSLRNVSTGELVETIELDNYRKINCFAFSPVDQRLAIGTSDRIELWNLASQKMEWNVAMDGGQVVFSRDGKSVAVRVGNSDSTSVSLLNVADGQLRFSKKPVDSVNFIYFTGEDESISAVKQYFVKLYPDVAILNLGSGKETAIEGLGRIDDPSEMPSTRIAITSDLSTLAISHFSYGYGDRAGEIRLVNAVTGESTGTLTATTGDIKCLVTSNDGKTVISGGTARKATALEIVNLKTGKLEATLRNVMFEADSPDGELLITKDLMTGGLVLWKTRDGGKLAEFPPCERAQFSPDGTILATLKPGVVELRNIADFLNVE